MGGLYTVSLSPTIRRVGIQSGLSDDLRAGDGGGGERVALNVNSAERRRHSIRPTRRLSREAPGSVSLSRPTLARREVGRLYQPDSEGKRLRCRTPWRGLAIQGATVSFHFW